MRTPNPYHPESLLPSLGPHCCHPEGAAARKPATARKCGRLPKDLWLGSAPNRPVACGLSGGVSEIPMNTPDTAPLRERIHALLEPASASALLDLGCGRGTDLRILGEVARHDARPMGV